MTKLNITSKLTLLLGLFGAALLVGLGTLAYTSGQAGLQQAATSELLTRAIEKQAALEIWITVERNNIAIQAVSPVVAEQAAALLSTEPGSPQAQAAHDRLVREFLPHTGSESRFMELFFIEAESGQVLVATDPGGEGKFKENLSFFIEGKREPYVSEMYYSTSLGRPAMTAAAPVKTADGRLLGVLAGQLDLDVLNTFIKRRTGQRQTDDAFLTNSIGLLVTQPRFISDPGILQKTLKTEAVQRCLDGNSGVISADDYRGVPALISYHWLPESQMCLIVKIDQAEAFAPSLAFGRTVAWASSLALVSAIVLAIRLARTFTRPILALEVGVKRLGQGDLDYSVAVKSSDEIGRLAMAFNEMAANLKRRVIALSALNDIATVVIESKSVDELFRRTMDEVFKQLDIEVGGILTLDRERDELVLIAHRGMSAGFIQAANRVKLGEGLAGKVAQTGEPIAIKDLTDYPGALKAFLEEENIQSAASVPLKGSKGVIGAMSLGARSPAYFDEAGLDLLVGIGTQIATGLEKLQLVQAEREALEFNDLILGASPVGVVTYKASGQCVSANEASARIIGATREQVLGQNFRQIASWKASGLSEAAEKTLTSGIDNHREVHLATTFGRDTWLDCYFARFFSGSMPHLLLSFSDSTERMQSERLQQILYQIAQAAVTTETLDELFSAIYDALGELLPAENFYIALYDPDSNVLSFPFYMDQYDEPPPPKKMGRGLTEYVLRTETPLLATPEVFKDLVQKGDVEQVGSESVDWLGVPLKIGGKTLGVMAVQSYDKGVRFGQNQIDILAFVSVQVANIIGRKRAEEQIQTYASKLERSNRDLQDFAYIASHDLQEPLRKVTAFGNRLVSKYEEALDETGRDYLARMLDATRRMQNLIDDLLALSRVTTKGKPFIQVNLTDVAQEVLSDLESRIEQTGGQVKVSELPVIEADPTQMRQLLQNLVGNALKFHKEGKAPMVRVSGTQEGGQFCQITVEDDGIGFDPQSTERIFQPFQRLHGRDEYEGSGMGLAICRRIAERHGGSITAESIPEQGATFTVTLPLYQQTK